MSDRSVPLSDRASSEPPSEPPSSSISSSAGSFSWRVGSRGGGRSAPSSSICVITNAYDERRGVSTARAFEKPYSGVLAHAARLVVKRVTV